MGSPLITIFTPIYNRPDTIIRLYNSLKNLNSYNFEWLIVDDGSTDNTKNILNEICNNHDSSFNIRCFHKKNGGKHRAINYAVPLALGELFYIVDSDDWLPADAISIITEYYYPVRFNTDIAGIAGLKLDAKRNISGTTFNGQYIDATSLERKKYGITGEKAEIFKTSILAKYPFPEFPNENFISEAVVWNKIANDGYKLRWFNKCIYYFEYQDNGLTARLRNNYRNNPKGYLTFVGQEFKFTKISYIRKLQLSGKCIDTIDTNKIKKTEVLQLLSLNKAEYIMAIIIYQLYKLIKK